MLIRQAHPGPSVQPYRTFEQKMRDAERHKSENHVPFTVLADDLPGTVHQVYGGLADPTYLIDKEGRVSFYSLWTHAPTLHEALTELKSRGGSGVVKGGYDRTPHLLATITDGWRGLRKGWPQSFIELETSAPGMASGPWLGYKLRPLLAPITLRGRPLPAPVKVGLGVAAAGLLILGARALARRQSGSSGSKGRRATKKGRRTL